MFLQGVLKSLTSYFMQCWFCPIHLIRWKSLLFVKNNRLLALDAPKCFIWEKIGEVRGIYNSTTIDLFVLRWYYVEWILFQCKREHLMVFWLNYRPHGKVMFLHLSVCLQGGGRHTPLDKKTLDKDPSPPPERTSMGPDRKCPHTPSSTDI